MCPHQGAVAAFAAVSGTAIGAGDFQKHPPRRGRKGPGMPVDYVRKIHEPWIDNENRVVRSETNRPSSLLEPFTQEGAKGGTAIETILAKKRLRAFQLRE